MTNSFAEKEIDASINFCYWLACLPCTFGAVPYKTTLLLQKEEVTKTDVVLCGRQVSKHPYGELGHIDKSNCFCCVSAHSGFGVVSPGCGCDEETVDEIVAELKQRIRERGDTAQIIRAEETLSKLGEIELKLDAILSHLNIPESEIMSGRED